MKLIALGNGSERESKRSGEKKKKKRRKSWEKYVYKLRGNDEISKKEDEREHFRRHYTTWEKPRRYG